ncbi:helix-turn-helix domain-containing protein [Clostridium tyrobutyricum]|uniref:helix-turn-helix domain-containing protein n=1 Tax=Clostridium tyrobutyricum TaxID=1519 RepID=UPI001C38B424|nr:helix-turn-helix domain-containing protein [Clostridium tyrobutyricum]MBV4417053.1 helix-turn-helix domain-containing protein [Clostridium tyrobutyricum]
MEINNVKNFIKNEVISSVEAAEILSISRQRISTMVKQERIIPIKILPNGYLFLRKEIEQLKNDRYDEESILPFSFNNILYCREEVTSNSIKFFKENIKKLDKIKDIYVYFNGIDAAMDNYYEPDETCRRGDLYLVRTPKFILKDIRGRELWLGGCNCGYNGEGPNGSKFILQQLKIDKNVIEKVFTNKVVKLINIGTNDYEVFAHDSYDQDASKVKLFYFKDHLVLLQDKNVNWDKNVLNLIDIYSFFIKDPQEIIIFKKNDEAAAAGYIPFADISDESYTCIIQDASGKQLWLKPHINSTLPILKQNTVMEVLKQCGFNLNKNLSRKKSWLESILRKKEPNVIHLRK